jgi:hypothetical protein
MSRVPCIERLQGGVAVIFDGEVEQRGENHGLSNAYTAVLALEPRHGTRILGKLWQLEELPAVSCYTGQGLVRGSGSRTPCDVGWWP